MKKMKVMVIALTMVTTFAMSAVAADWNFYGDARIETFITDNNNPGTADTKSLSESLQSNSRIGANVKVNDQLTGRFEYGTEVNVRHLFGEWNFGAGKLLVGQTFVLSDISVSGQVYGTDDGLCGYGAPNVNRDPQLRLTFGDFAIAAIAPRTDEFNGIDEGGALDIATKQVNFPKIEASYTMNFDNAYVTGVAGYQAYENIIAGSTPVDMDSYLVTFAGGMTFGNFYLNANLFFGQNLAGYGFYSDVDLAPDYTASTLTDNDASGLILVTGAKINDMFSVEAGYGFVKAEIDAAGFSDDEAASYYVQTTITLAPGVVIIPEIGKIDRKTNKFNVAQSDTLYYGAKWQINF